MTCTYSGVDVRPSIRTYMYSWKRLCMWRSGTSWYVNKNFPTQTTMRKPPTLRQRDRGACPIPAFSLCPFSFSSFCLGLISYMGLKDRLFRSQNSVKLRPGYWLQRSDFSWPKPENHTFASLLSLEDRMICAHWQGINFWNTGDVETHRSTIIFFVIEVRWQFKWGETSPLIGNTKALTDCKLWVLMKADFN